MEGLMQAGKVAQKLLNTMSMSQQNMGQQNVSNMMNKNQRGLLGNPQNMNNNAAASNFMNTIQQLAMQKLGQNTNRNKPDMNSLFGNNSSNGGSIGNNTSTTTNSGDGLLGNYQGPGEYVYTFMCVFKSSHIDTFHAVVNKIFFVVICMWVQLLSEDLLPCHNNQS